MVVFFSLVSPGSLGEAPQQASRFTFFRSQLCSPRLRAEVGSFQEEFNAERIDHLLAPLPPASVAIDKALFVAPDMGCRAAVATDLNFSVRWLD
jgi:hypothetical protein